MKNRLTPEQKRFGRPRTAGVEDRVFDATLDLLGRLGYDATSMAAIASEAGVTKPTLYRRWESKEDLVTSAVSTLAATGPTFSSDDVWENLIAELEMFHAAVSRREGMALIGNVLALEQRQPRLIELYRRKVVSVRRARILAVLEEGRRSGIVDADVDIVVVVNMLIGYYYAARVSGFAIEDDWPRRCVELVRNGIHPNIS